MANWIPIIKKISSAIVRIVVADSHQIKSEGAGTIIDSSGMIVTAFHVVEEAILAKWKILVYTSLGLKEYKAISSDVNLIVELDANNKISYHVDISLLQPILAFDTSGIYLSPAVDYNIVELGRQVLIAGYSEETPDMFNIKDWLRKLNIEPARDRDKESLTHIVGSLRPPTFKSGIISNVQHFYGESLTLHFQHIFVDNGAHGGMSGGPIVDENEKLIGLITQRMTVESSAISDNRKIIFEVPSGNTLGITLEVLTIFK